LGGKKSKEKDCLALRRNGERRNYAGGKRGEKGGLVLPAGIGSSRANATRGRERSPGKVSEEVSRSAKSKERPARAIRPVMAGTGEGRSCAARGIPEMSGKGRKGKERMKPRRDRRLVKR